MNQDNTKVEASLTMAEVITPDLANFYGNLHGGHLLNLLDKVAYACSSRYAAKPTVTLSVDQVFFKEPIYVGELITCYASINLVGKTSMEVGIRVVTENLQTRVKRHTNTCYFTMVAIDEHGKPTTVPPFTPQTDVEKRRYQEATKRREARLNKFST
jgi:acyl-CoA hydrolase